MKLDIYDRLYIIGAIIALILFLTIITNIVIEYSKHKKSTIPEDLPKYKIYYEYNIINTYCIQTDSIGLPIWISRDTIPVDTIISKY